MKQKARDIISSFSKKTGVILTVFILCTVIPVLILGIFSIRTANRKILEEYRSLTVQTAQRVRSILFDITTSAYTVSDSILAGNECMYLFAADDAGGSTMETYYTHVTDTMKSVEDSNASVSSVHIYTDNPAIRDNAYISSLARQYKGEEWYASLTGGSWSKWMCLSNADPINQDKHQLTLTRRIPIATSKYTAYLVIRLDSNTLKNRIGEDGHLVSIALSDGNVFYSSDASLQNQALALPSAYKGQNSFIGKMDVKGSSVLTSIRTLLPYKTDSQFIIEVCDLSAFSDIFGITKSFLLIIAVVLASVIAIVLFFSRKLARQELINKQQEMEFKMLASQINPHFLYNTLETIRMQALVSQNRDVATSIKLLGKSMHYVLENTGTRFTTLERELDHVKTYLMIQEIRFGDRLGYCFETDPQIQAEKYPILPLLLQPIVENAVIHGLENVTAEGLVTISVQQDPSFLILTVKDNGSGMTAEELQSLKEKVFDGKDVSSSSRSSIGLYNICQRIRLCYGDKASMTIESTPGSGTAVTLRLPHIRKGT